MLEGEEKEDRDGERVVNGKDEKRLRILGVIFHTQNVRIGKNIGRQVDDESFNTYSVLEYVCFS